MNKQEKSIWNKLKNQYADNAEVLDILCNGENARHKQLPKKPSNLNEVNFNGSIRANFKNGECPCCGEYVDSDNDRFYCSHKKCGQALDWSDKDE